MTIKQAVRQRILDYCAQQQLTLNGLSTRCGITQSTLQNIVSGRNHSVTLSTIKKICDGLDISIVDFFSCELFGNLEQELK